MKSEERAHSNHFSAERFGNAGLQRDRMSTMSAKLAKLSAHLSKLSSRRSNEVNVIFRQIHYPQAGSRAGRASEQTALW